MLTPADMTAKEGTQVVVPYRDEDQKRHLKVMGDLGQIVSLVRIVSALACQLTLALAL